MKTGFLVQLALTFLPVAIFSIGGASALIPEFYRQIVDIRGWMSGEEFAHLVALGQIAPGPNMLIVALIGWKLAGLSGLLVATVAMVGPTSVLAFAAGRWLRRVGEAPWLGMVKAALAPVVVGLMLASGMITSRAANVNAIGYVLTAGAALFVYMLKRNPLWAIAAGALAGIVARHAGILVG